MNKISPLDIRIAVLAYPFVSKAENNTAILRPKTPIAPYRGDERIVSLFENLPKHQIEPSKSKMPRVIRKGQYALIRLLEILKSLLEERPASTLLFDICPPRKLRVPQLPHPVFKTPKPPRFFWHSACDAYAPSCLMSEAKEELPSTISNHAYIAAYARSALPQKGILHQNEEGYVCLKLSEDFIAELFPLIHEERCEAIPLPAHIPVILPLEWAQRKGWGEIKDLDQTFSFKIEGLYSARPKRWPGIDKVYFLKVSAPELEQLRERYLLPSRIRGHDFHIAIAYRAAHPQAPTDAKKETFRLNVSCFAA